MVGPRPAPDPRIGWLNLPPVRYPKLYAWFVFLSSLDIMLTWVILSLDGAEVNPIADGVLRDRGLIGLILFKFSLVLLIIVMCEAVGRRRREVGARLAHWCVAITAIPIVAAYSQLWMHRENLLFDPTAEPPPISQPISIAKRAADAPPPPDQLSSGESAQVVDEF